jgi:hypothetical protein
MESNNLEPFNMSLKEKDNIEDTMCLDTINQSQDLNEVEVNNEIQLTGKVGNGSSGEIEGGTEHEEHGLGIKRQREGGDTTESEDSEKIENWITIDRKAKRERKTQINGSDKSNQATNRDKDDLQVYITSKDPLPKQFSLARLLKENDIKGICGVKYLNPFKVRIQFESLVHMEQLYNCENVSKKGWLMHKPLEIGHCYGIIRDVDPELSDEEILKMITCSETVIAAKRLNCRDRSDGHWRPSEVARLFFKSTQLPPYVFVDGLRIRVEPYVHPVSQCYKCWKIGHNIRSCPAKTCMCPKCGGSHSNCEIKTFTCVNCRGNHISMAKSCPVYLKERRLRELMSEFQCTYRKALTLYVAPSPNPLDELGPQIDARKQFPILKNSTTFTVENSPLLPSYKDILTDSEVAPTEKSKEETKRGTIPKDASELIKQGRAKKEKKMTSRREQQPDPEVFEMDWNKVYENESDDEEGEDRKANFSELLKRLKDVIFFNNLSIRDKIHGVIKISVEWLVIFVAGLFSDSPMVKSFLNFITNGWFG